MINPNWVSPRPEQEHRDVLFLAYRKRNNGPYDSEIPLFSTGGVQVRTSSSHMRITCVG